jgi:hypothetical protein
LEIRLHRWPPLPHKWARQQRRPIGRDEPALVGLTNALGRLFGVPNGLKYLPSNVTSAACRRATDSPLRWEVIRDGGALGDQTRIRNQATQTNEMSYRLAKL